MSKTSLKACITWANLAQLAETQMATRLATCQACMMFAPVSCQRGKESIDSLEGIKTGRPWLTYPEVKLQGVRGSRL